MLCFSIDGTTQCWNLKYQKVYLEVGMSVVLLPSQNVHLRDGLVSQSRLDLHIYHANQRVDANNSQGRLRRSVSQHEWGSIFIIAVNQKCLIL
jgi:hypothetical protein